MRAAWATQIVTLGDGLSFSPRKARREYEMHETIHDRQKLNHVEYRLTLGDSAAVQRRSTKPAAPVSSNAMNTRKTVRFGARFRDSRERKRLPYQQAVLNDG